MDVCIDNLTLTFGDFTAVKSLNLDIEDGESLVLLGQSGCGKTSTMRCVAGLEDPNGGSITIGGTTVFDAGRKVNLAPNKRNVGLVFQSYAVWPHMTVLENVMFPLKMKKRPKAEAKTKAIETLELVGLAHLASRGASMLSGGQMQRVALARSLAMEPAVMLLDEPLSNLDARLREDLRVELRRLQLELGLTCIYVTHDQGEALALADRIAIMQGGRISQLADPWETYRAPASASIAAFLGVSNIFSVRPPEGGVDRLRLREHDLEMAFGTELPSDTSDLSVCVRPEHVRLRSLDDGGVSDRPNTWPGRVEVSVFQGSFARCSVRLDAGPVIEVQSHEEAAGLLHKDDRVVVEVDPKHVRVLPGEVPVPGKDS
ncbi:ABC transporter ATP-binding protein [Gordonia sp. zg691]|uniref:Trehalose import ATP-binding protein SugC n=1 Tax=Gordonia jinghuaiqii TaxID=2758710 RepID=A0A7D7QGN0_9ACTN|nr:ABC transporter ATP-binding protein [Gordonia jinghuaiqii]MBD0862857.1 ABC transporter ATP-binding protein [Gordonia jinghuaiqii]MCR5979011.1 ATP-binding cassette domain-containing protein [Gordonia jinghuaiqii]QMT01662.1 ABC transporter ATP-binding protein [Gordonia jinghuaiqii]